MPGLPSPGPILRVEFLTGDDASHEAGSRFYLSYSGAAPSSGDLSTLATAVSTDWGTHIASLVNESYSLHGVDITDLSSDTGAIGSWAGTVAGTRTGDFLPANAAAVMNHAILRRYRGGRPRTFLCCGVEEDMEGTNEWTEAFQTAVLTGWEAWIAEILATTGIGITSLALVNVSWYKGNTVFTTPTGRARNIPTPRTTPVVDNIQSTSVAPKIGSQRRRLDL